MDPLQTSALITSYTRPVEARSALPDAPVVPPPEHRPAAAAAARVRLATVLHRLADAVAPNGDGRPARQVYALGRSR